MYLIILYFIKIQKNVYIILIVIYNITLTT